MWTRSSYRLSGAAAVLLLGLLNACGGGGDNGFIPPPPPPPTPAATITGMGEGCLTIHPSTDRRFGVALETPLRITETTGGTADWNFARISIFRGGAEIERFELGSDVIRAGGYGRINPRSNQLVSVTFRQNSSDFDRVDITLGFGDIKDARQFTVPVPFTSFNDVCLSFTPMSVPPSGQVTAGTP